MMITKDIVGSSLIGQLIQPPMWPHIGCRCQMSLHGRVSLKN